MSSRRDLAIGVLLSALAGLVIGTLGTFKHQVGVSAATGAGFPVGLLLSLAMVLAVLTALRVGFGTRWFALAAGIGVVVAVLVLTLPGASGGSTVILLNAEGIVWTAGTPVLGAAVVAWPARRRPGVREAGGILESAEAKKDD